MDFNSPLGSSAPPSPLSPAIASPALAEVDRILEQFSHFGMELGLERVLRLLQALGNPQDRVPFLHVAGSNGKGSVCAYLSSVLTTSGYRVGRYTSPHLVNWCERISVNGQAIAPEILMKYLQHVVSAIDPQNPSPTQFEVITAVAWLYFAQEAVDIAVMEVGLGGRLDATNVGDRPLVSVITSLSREHWQRLGPTLADIAREKAGILKPRCPAVIAPLPPETEPVIHQRLAELDCPVWWVQPSHAIGQSWGRFPAQGDWAALDYPLALPGEHQLTNSATAIATLRLLQRQGWHITDEHIIQGMANTRWAARLQWFTWQGQEILIDAAHNPAGAATLRHYLDQSDRVTQPVHWVMGLLTTKDHADIFQALLRSGDSLYLVPVPDHLSTDPIHLAPLAWEICPDLASCTPCADVFAGLLSAIRAGASSEPPPTTVLCGSIYLIGHFFKQIGASVG